MVAEILALLKSFVDAFTAYTKNDAIRTRNALRNEEKTLRADILAAAAAGNIQLQNELENQLADCRRDSAAVQSPA